jgi:hypothetical protein
MGSNNKAAILDQIHAHVPDCAMCRTGDGECEKGAHLMDLYQASATATADAPLAPTGPRYPNVRVSGGELVEAARVEATREYRARTLVHEGTALDSCHKHGCEGCEPSNVRILADHAEALAMNTERVEVGADGCGCPVTGEITASGADVEGTDRTEHRAGCWNAPASTDVQPAMSARRDAWYQQVRWHKAHLACCGGHGTSVEAEARYVAHAEREAYSIKCEYDLRDREYAERDAFYARNAAV